MKKILFISHDASRSGAPFVLLYLLQWLKKHTDYKFNVLLLKDGPIKNEFKEVADQLFLLPEIAMDHSIKARIERKIKFKKWEPEDINWISKKIDIKSYDLIYGNTIVCLSWLIQFKSLFNVKVINAIHELRMNMELYYTKEYISTNLPKIDLIIAGSGAVANELEGRYNIPSTKINVIHAFIHTFIKPVQQPLLLESSNIPKDRFIIGGVGNAELRKGVDLLIPLAMYFKKHHPDFDFHLIWIGGNEHNPFIKNLLVDINKACVSDRITILDSTSKYLNYMERFDIFAMLSREDPFPLVSLEASYLEKPIVMFEGGGGTSELLINGGGVIVPYLDIEVLAESILQLSLDKAGMLEKGAILKREVIEKYNSEVACKKVLAVLDSVMN